MSRSKLERGIGIWRKIPRTEGSMYKGLDVTAQGIVERPEICPYFIVPVVWAAR